MFREPMWTQEKILFIKYLETNAGVPVIKDYFDGLILMQNKTVALLWQLFMSGLKFLKVTV